MKVIIALTILLAVIFVGLPLMAWVFYGVWKYFFDILGIALVLAALFGLVLTFKVYKKANLSNEEYLAEKKREMINAKQKEIGDSDKIVTESDIEFDAVGILKSRYGKGMVAFILLISLSLGYAASSSFEYQDKREIIITQEEKLNEEKSIRKKRNKRSKKPPNRNELTMKR